MVVADCSSSACADVVFVIEGTANLHAYIDQLKTSYIIPTLEHFNGGPVVDYSDFGAKFGGTRYALVVYNTADCAPNQAAICTSPTSNAHKMLTTFESIEFLSGAGEKYSMVSEGLSTALQLFDDMKTLRYISTPVQKHCILICNSPPYPLPSQDSINYSGFTAEQLAAMLGERGVHFSIISPRKLPELQKLYDRACGELQILPAKDYATDPRHMILLKGYQLAEKTTSTMSGGGDTKEVAIVKPTTTTTTTVSTTATSAQPLKPASTVTMVTGPGSSITTNPLKSTVGSPSPALPQSLTGSPQAGTKRPTSRPGVGSPSNQAPLFKAPATSNVQTGAASTTISHMSPGQPGQIGNQTQQSSSQQKLSQPGQSQIQTQGQRPSISFAQPTSLPNQPVSTVPTNRTQQPNVTVSSIPLTPFSNTQSTSPPKITSQQAPVAALKAAEGVMQMAHASQFGKTPPIAAVNPINTQPQQRWTPDQQPQRGAGMQAAMRPQVQSTQPTVSSVNMNQPVTTGANIIPNLAQQQLQTQTTANTTLPMDLDIQGSSTAQVQPVRPQQQVEQQQKSVVWRGALEWQEKPRGASQDPSARVTRSVACSVIASPTDNLQADNWPTKLVMQLIPQQLLQSLGAMFRNSRSVEFQFINNNQEAYRSLLRIMSGGFAGCVHFNSPAQCDVRVLMLLYIHRKRQFIGLIPNDQASFVTGIRTVITNHKNKQQQKNTLMHVQKQQQRVQLQQQQTLVCDTSSKQFTPQQSTTTVTQPSLQHLPSGNLSNIGLSAQQTQVSSGAQSLISQQQQQQQQQQQSQQQQSVGLQSVPKETIQAQREANWKWEMLPQNVIDCQYERQVNQRNIQALQKNLEMAQKKELELKQQQDQHARQTLIAQRQQQQQLQRLQQQRAQQQQQQQAAAAQAQPSNIQSTNQQLRHLLLSQQQQQQQQSSATQPTIPPQQQPSAQQQQTWQQQQQQQFLQQQLLIGQQQRQRPQVSQLGLAPSMQQTQQQTSSSLLADDMSLFDLLNP